MRAKLTYVHALVMSKIFWELHADPLSKEGSSGGRKGKRREEKGRVSARNLDTLSIFMYF